ncbi:MULTISPECIES: VPA1267 family protein [Ramlibacter]|uniref:VPA1267 family protein n=1 Tax=Ramlibacter TaxID=174951 RepID=UPI0012FC904E|nr:MULTISPECIES: VPA1267 family protein [Ramlibacter]
MSSGQQLAEENFQRFVTWAAAKSDEEYRSMVSRGVLSRTEIAAECGFAKSALSQNPRVRQSLSDLESGLRARGVLPQAVQAAAQAPALRQREVSGLATARDAERLKRLEQDNASLRAEVAELKRLLSRYADLQEALAETGRVPR